MGRLRQTLSRADERRLVAAVTAAERGHRGEIRVHIERRYPGDGPRARAASLFDELGMTETAEGTGVLLYVAVADRKVAVHAGPGIYGAEAPGFWKEVTDTVAAGFARADAAGALVAAVARLGEVLRRHAAGVDAAGNELDDAVSVG